MKLLTKEIEFYPSISATYTPPKYILTEGNIGKTIDTQRIIIELYETKNISFVGRYHEGKFLKFQIK